MKLLKRIQEAKEAWGILMPHIPLPADTVLGAWVTRFSENSLETALLRGSKKFAPRKVDLATLDAADVYRYIAGVVRHEHEANKEKSMTVKNDVTAEMQADFEARTPDDVFREKSKTLIEEHGPNPTLADVEALLAE
jgi:hypothetical protein